MDAPAYVVGVVPARGGSVGIPRKNVQLLAGLPLVAHTLRAGRATRRLDGLVCTTDCPEVGRIAEEFDVPVIARPAELADGAACMRDVMMDLDRRLREGPGGLPQDRPVWYVLLYPTSPLRTARHIEACIDQAVRVAPFDSVVSVCEIATAPPSGFTLDDAGGLHFVDPAERNYYQRQNKRPKYRLNGAIWVLNAARFEHMNRNMIGARTYALVMDAESSIDVDTPIDLQLAQLLLAARAAGGRAHVA